MMACRRRKSVHPHRQKQYQKDHLQNGGVDKYDRQKKYIEEGVPVGRKRKTASEMTTN